MEVAERHGRSAQAVPLAPTQKRRTRRRTMKYICLGYIKLGTFEGMNQARDMNHAVQLMAQHPALKYGSIFEIRPAADLNELMKVSEQRRQQNTAR
jgi:hypothetical protein